MEINKLIQDNADAEPSLKFVDSKDKNEWFYRYLHYAVVNNIIEGRQYVIAGKMVRKADMSQGVLFGEAAKILYLARSLEN